MERLLHEQKQRVSELLGANMHLVAALRDALVERHELIGTEITSCSRSRPPTTPQLTAAIRSEIGSRALISSSSSSAVSPSYGAAARASVTDSISVFVARPAQ